MKEIEGQLASEELYDFRLLKTFWKLTRFEDVVKDFILHLNSFLKNYIDSCCCHVLYFGRSRGLAVPKVIKRLQY